MLPDALRALVRAPVPRPARGERCHLGRDPGARERALVREVAGRRGGRNRRATEQRRVLEDLRPGVPPAPRLRRCETSSRGTGASTATLSTGSTSDGERSGSSAMCARPTTGPAAIRKVSSGSLPDQPPRTGRRLPGPAGPLLVGPGLESHPRGIGWHPPFELQPQRDLPVLAQPADEIQVDVVREADLVTPAAAGEGPGADHEGRPHARQQGEERNREQRRGRHDAGDRAAQAERRHAAALAAESRRDVEVDETCQQDHRQDQEAEQVGDDRRMGGRGHRGEEEEEDPDPRLPLVLLAAQRPQLGRDAEQGQVQDRPYRLDPPQRQDVENQERQVGEPEHVERAVRQPALRSGGGAPEEEHHGHHEGDERRPLEGVVERQGHGHPERHQAEQQPLLAPEGHAAAPALRPRERRSWSAPLSPGTSVRGEGAVGWTRASTSSTSRRWRGPLPNATRRPWVTNSTSKPRSRWSTAAVAASDTRRSKRSLSAGAENGAQPSSKRIESRSVSSASRSR